MKDWNNLEKKTFSLNARTMNTLFCALDKTKFNQVSTYETALTFDILLKSHMKVLANLKIQKSIF